MRVSLKLLSLLVLCSVPCSLLAKPVAASDFQSKAPFWTANYFPHAYLTGYVGDELGTKADLLVPIYINGKQAFFAYGQYHYNNDYDMPRMLGTTWMASAGAGYRQIARSRIWGVYLFADRNVSPGKHVFWTVSPGVETLGNTWDFRANGYFPVGKRQWLDKEGWADDFDDYSHVRFSGHSEYDHWYQYYSIIGPGVDAEVGHTLFIPQLKGFVDGYHFWLDHAKDVNGIGARFTAQVSRSTTFMFEDSYDNNKHNTALVSVRIALNNLWQKNQQLPDDAALASRLVDPIERGFGTEAIANSTIGAERLKDEGEQPSPEFNNIWFFGNNSYGNGDGTYENPFANGEFTQNTLNNINTQMVNMGLSAARLYFRSNYGSYLAEGESGNPIADNPIDILNNFSMFGRTEDFTAPASGAGCSLFIGGFNLLGNNSLNDIILKNHTADGVNSYNLVGINLNGVSGIALNDVTVGSQNSDGAFQTAVLANNSNLTINNSQIYSYNDSGNATGIEITNGGNLNVNDSEIDAHAETTTSTADNSGNAYGIHADGDAEVINLDDDGISANGSVITTSAADSGNGFGVLIGNEIADATSQAIHDNVLDIADSTIDGDGAVTASVAGNSGDGFGVLIGDDHVNGETDTVDSPVYANNLDIVDSAIDGNGSADPQVSANESGNGFGVLIGDAYSDINNPSETSTTDLSVHNNSVEVSQNSDISGDGSMPIIGTNVDDSGNGYGLVVGDGYDYIAASSEPVDVAVTDNSVTVASASQLTGSGLAIYKYDGINPEEYSGNGYGLLVGYDAIFDPVQHPQPSSDTSSVDLNSEVADNSVSISGQSSISGHGASAYTVPETSALHVGNGYGVVIGGGYANLPHSSAAALENVQDNTLTATDSSISAIGNAPDDANASGSVSGSAYAVVDGYTDVQDANKYTIEDETVSLSGDAISSTVVTGGGDHVGGQIGYGVAFGIDGDIGSSSGSSVNVGGDSVITVSVPGTENYAYGIGMLQDSGLLDVTDAIFSAQPAGTLGDAVLTPDGNSDPWPPVP